MMTQGSPSSAPAGAESSHAADAGLGRRRTDPPHAAAASEPVLQPPPVRAQDHERQITTPRCIYRQYVERELGAMERALAHLGLEDLNSIVEVYGPGRIVDTGVQMGLTSGPAFDLRMNDPDDGKPWDLSLESKRHT